jgi:hypothetical protein
MSTEFDPLRWLDEVAPAGGVRFRHLMTADRSAIQSVSLGVLFVMAWWSGPSIQAFAKLKQALATLDPSRRLELVVVDTDGASDLYECPEFLGQLRGAGEVAWLRDGHIVSTSGLGFRPECFEPNTRMLLALATNE